MIGDYIPFTAYDNKTQKWFKQNPSAETTVMKCNCCGLFYKPSLGHQCKIKKEKIHD